MSLACLLADLQALVCLLVGINEMHRHPDIWQSSGWIFGSRREGRRGGGGGRGLLLVEPKDPKLGEWGKTNPPMHFEYG